jgi:hypothetical protein
MGKSRDARSQWGNELVLNQRKRGGRLRLLITALVVTSVSIVGAVGTAFATPTNSATGTLEICKAASGDSFAGTFGFKVQGLSEVVEVQVGLCSLPIKLRPGTVTVTEVERPGYSVEGIATVPANRLQEKNLGAGTAKVAIVAGDANQTMLTFTNKVIPKGYLEVCKAKPNDNDKLEGYGSFTVGQPGSQPQTVSVRVGACSLPIQLTPGPATITEVANSGAQLVDIETTPEDRVLSKDLTRRSVTVEIVAGGRSAQTMVTFINKKVIPPPTTGLVKICKRAGRGVEQGTPFTFTVGGKTLVVQAGECSSKQTVPFGRLTVTEKAAPWTQVSDIDVDPSGAVVSRNLRDGTVIVEVKADRVVTEVDFTNTATPPGTLKVCKVPGTGVVPRTPFSFTVGTRRVTIPAGSCLPLTLPAGKVEISEAATAGLFVTDIKVVGAGGLISANPSDGKALVNVASGQITEVLYTNARRNTPGSGCVQPMRWFKHHPGDVKGLVPTGGLMVGGDRLTAAQVQAILEKAARSGNFRFELEGELIAALLNQARRASTPASVQAAINAAQLLLSQSDGALHNGAINSTRLDWWATVTYNGQTYQAGQLVDTLSSFNEGAARGGPRSCSKHRGDGHDDGKDDNHKNDNHKNDNFKWHNRYCWPI